MAEMTHNTVEEHVVLYPNHDTVNLFGRSMTVPGGIYTVVFIGLGILTILEVMIAELLGGAIAATPGGTSAVVALQWLPALKGLLLLGMAIVKSALVILFYMHLKDDNRLLAIVLLLPLLIASLSVIFVLSIPPTGYSI